MEVRAHPASIPLAEEFTIARGTRSATEVVRVEVEQHDGLTGRGEAAPIYRSIDVAGTVLVALTLAPVILALSKGSDWAGPRRRPVGCLVIGVAAGVAFVAVERRVKVPLLDLALLRNRVLVGSTVAILIGAGTINALMYLLSLYFQDPATLGFSPLQAGLGTPTRDGRARGGGPAGPQAGGQVRWPVRGRGRVRDHRRRVRRHRPQPEHVGVRGLRPPAGRRRRRHGAVQRAGLVGRDRRRLGEPGR